MEQKNSDKSLTCPICLSFFKQVTTIEGCCHQFCLNCITKKISEEDLHSCPVCNADLGCDPLQKLRLQQSQEPTWDKILLERVASVIATTGFNNLNPSETVTVDDTKNKSFWFALIASDKQKCKPPLEQIPTKYLRVKDGNITVSSMKQYLVRKLNLSNVNEVEISLQGCLLHPAEQLYKLLKLWLHTTPAKTERAYVGSSAEDFVLTLTYGRGAN